MMSTGGRVGAGLAGLLFAITAGLIACAPLIPTTFPSFESPAPASSQGPVEFSITVVNRSSHAAIVSLHTDIAGSDPGFLSHQQGTVHLQAGTADNGVGLELLDFPACHVQFETTYPSTTSFSLFLDDDATGSGIVVSTGPADWATSAPLPDNGVHCGQG